MSFYQDTADPNFRFGDVIKGFISATPVINSPPILNGQSTFQIDVVSYDFFIVLSPCCSINESVVSLCPLIKLRTTFFDNPYFVEDLTRINRRMTAQQTLPPATWERLPEPERQRRQAEGLSLAFVELFVFPGNPLFPEYELSKRDRTTVKTNFYMIDFRNTFRVGCDKITNNSTPSTGVKLLQLSIEARSELREKVSGYFARVPKEDKVEA